jgi:hypothetical protein
MTTQAAIKPELEPVPAKMRGLRIDNRGYPIPWFVDPATRQEDGSIDFRFMSQERFVRAIKQRLCWVCGNGLGTHKVFVAGPMCGINRTSAEPPCHLECAQYSARNCPFLSNPHALRREDQLSSGNLCNVAGMPITRNPGVTLLWVTKHFDVFNDGQGKPLLFMGEPTRCEWYREGRAATRAEVQESIRTGLPALEAVARTEPGAMEALARARSEFERHLPAA